jgi:hypothetical protein
MHFRNEIKDVEVAGVKEMISACGFYLGNILENDHLGG